MYSSRSKSTALASLLLLSTGAGAATNNPPVISGVPASTVQVSKTYRFYATAKDPEGSRLYFSIKNKPSWAWFDSSAGILGGEPQAVGTYSNIVISVTDGVSTVSLPAFSITALGGTTSSTPSNRAPTISGVPASSVPVTKTYRFFASATDADGDPVTFSIANKPTWAWFDAKLGILGGEPQTAGTYSNIVISASDGKSSASLPAFSITAVSSEPVKPANTAPVISGAPVGAVAAGTTYSFQPSASDANNDTLTFSVANKPAWATFDSASGRLSGTPLATQVGTYAGIAISVSDGVSVASMPAFSVVVAKAANRAPTISGVAASSVPVTKTYRFFASASDADGDALTFSIANKPSWAWFDAKQGILGGEPQAVGTYSNIVVSVSDGKSSTSLAPFSITATGTENDKPVLSGSPQRAVTAGSAYVFQPSASDPNGDPLAFSISNKPAWATFSTATGRLTGTPQAKDVATYGGIVISVSDGKSETVLPTFAVSVDPTANTSGSAALSWTPPTENIDGSALVDLAGYRLYYGASADTLDQVIEIKNPGVADYVIDNLTAGQYYFAIKAYNSSGAESVKSGVASKVVQ